MGTHKIIGVAATLTLLPFTLPSATRAEGLQVAPVSLTLSATRSADGLTLANLGSGPVHAQVRVYRWTQDAAGEHLDPTDAIFISPPMVSLQPGDRQMVRVIRNGDKPAPAVAEDSYRIIIDEIPSIADERKGGINFVMRYSLPVFVTGSAAKPAPALEWKLVPVDGKIALEVRNSGAMHAQLAEVTLADASGRLTPLAPGLLGYVLPGATTRWGTNEPWPIAPTRGTLRVKVNGQDMQETAPFLTPPRE